MLAFGSADKVSAKYDSAEHLQAGNRLSASSFRVTAIACWTSVLNGLVAIFPFLLLLKRSFISISPSSYQSGRDWPIKVRAKPLKTGADGPISALWSLP
jgi:hypothetical protein